MSKKVFKGRVICKGNYEGECVVSRQGLNTLATFQKSALKNAKKVKKVAADEEDDYNIEINDGINNYEQPNEEPIQVEEA